MLKFPGKILAKFMQKNMTLKNTSNNKIKNKKQKNLSSANNGENKAPKIKIQFYNTLGRKLQEFKPLSKDKVVNMYNCGPTIYDFAHVGNFRSFIFADTLRRVLEYFGFKVNQVMNITDVGHLTSDDDLGEDKIIKGLRREQKDKGEKITVYDLINMYTKHFKNDIAELNIRTPTYMPHASAHVEDMIRLIEELVKKGYAYVTKKAVYFDVTKFKDYTKLSNQALDEKIVGARNEVNVDPDKKHPADFRLWQLDQPNHLMQWDSPWGKGFPGWHIECSAMSMKYLGPTLDIHTGGVDHIPVHHTNEIAQSEAATGKPFSRFWMHNEFLTVEGGKMSKSLGNFYTLQDIKKMGFKPMHLRYFYLTAKYRAKLDFSKKALESAKNSYEKILLMYKTILAEISKHIFVHKKSCKSTLEKINKLMKKYYLPEDPQRILTYSKAYGLAKSKKAKEYIVKFSGALADDLNTPVGISHLLSGLKDASLDMYDKLLLLSLFENVLGLKLSDYKDPLFEAVKYDCKKAKEILDLLLTRDKARKNKDFNTADKIRNKLSKLGYNVIDSVTAGTIILN